MSAAVAKSQASDALRFVTADASPEDVARHLVATVREGSMRRPFVQIVARVSDRERLDAQVRLKRLLQQGRFGEAVALCVAELGPHARNDSVRRIVFALLRRPHWRRRLMPVLRARVQDREPDPVPGGLLLYGLMQAGRLPRTELTSPLVWAISVTWLLDHVPPDAMLPLSRHLAAAYPKISFLADVADGLDQAPPREPGDRFADHPDADLQLVRAPDRVAAPLMICFTGLLGRMGTPINTFHRWVARENMNVLYLKDLRQRFYREGLVTLGGGRRAGAERLHALLGALARELAAPEIAVYGISMGGVPALEAALALGARRMVWAAGAIEREDRSQPWNDATESGRRLAAARELLDRLRSSRCTPEIACIYGAGFRSDAEMPEVLAAHPSVQLHPLDGLSSHNVDFHLVKAGRFERLIRWAAFGPEPLELS